MSEIQETLPSEYVPLKIRRIMRVVTKAILIRLDNGEEHWLPLSQIKPPETPFKQNQRNLTIEVAGWLIEQKRLGMSQRMPDDILLMIQGVTEWDKFALTALTDRIMDSDGSWLEDCLRILVGLSPVHQEIKTIGELMEWIKDDTTKGIYNRIVKALNWMMAGKGWENLPMDKLTKCTQKELSNVPGLGKRTLEDLRLILHRHGFLLEGDTRSAVEEMEAGLWGVEDDDY